jgi:hypothetical protein
MLGYFSASNGHLNCLIYCHEKNYINKDHICLQAAKNGYLNCLKYGYDNGFLCNEDVFTKAAEEGHLECLKYLHLINCPINKNINIFTRGNLECLKFLHKIGIDWDNLICSI